MKLLKNVCIALALLLMSACTSPPAEFADGYQFGDITRFTASQLMNLDSARKTYCDQTSSSAIKKLAIAAIQTQLPAYPPDGVCTHLMDVLLNPIEAKARASP